jgi:ABC-type branched-subunit amino acid transport system ATPase component
MPKRVLTEGEIAVLTVIQQGYGEHHTLDRVYFSPADDAIIFVRGTNGMSILLANLSNLAARRADGTIASDDELRKKHLRLK